jgi:type III pantothenate kinase
MTNLRNQKDKKIVARVAPPKGSLMGRGSPSRTEPIGEYEKGPQRQDPAQSKNFLAVDVGNTFIHLAVFKGDKVVVRKSVRTVQKNSDLKINISVVLSAFKKADPQLGKVVVCSVVPSVTKVLEPLVKKYLRINPSIIGRDINVPIKNLYANPRQVGQDRLVCAYAASELYGYPAIVIDLGTAITLDVVSAKREYLGGIIVPGIHITAETLFERTALLPLVEITKPKHLIGKDTQGSILSGIFFGYGEMLKGLINLLSNNLKASPKVIITGGHAKLMAEHIKERLNVIEPDLVLRGISLLAKK